jgi:hypothetical protein
MSHPITADYATLPLPLTRTERQELDRLEAVIEQGLPTFYAVGAALVTIRNQRLYRTEFRTFEEYCAQKWQIGRASVYRMIDAAELKEVLSPTGDAPLPTNENQVRALKAAPVEQQAAIWEQAQATAPAGKVTAKHITKIVQTVLPPEQESPPAEPTRQISVFIPAEPEPARGPVTMACDGCQQPFWVMALHVHGGKHLCQACFHITLDNELAAVDHPEPEPSKPCRIVTTCDFCQMVLPLEQAYASYDQKQCLRSAICRTCASQALHDLRDVSDQDVLSDVVTKQDCQVVGFGWQTDDRAKIVKAGLRILRVGGRFGMHELMELRPMKSGQNSYSWQLLEKFPSQAALKRRITELAKEPHIIMENRP